MPTCQKPAETDILTVVRTAGSRPGWRTMAGSGRRNADDRLALELAAGRTVADAAKAAGVSQRTAYRRLDDAGYRQRISTLRSAMVDRATGRLADRSTDAVETLGVLLAAESEWSGSARPDRSWILGTKLRESTEIEERLAALEQRAKERTHKELHENGYGKR